MKKFKAVISRLRRENAKVVIVKDLARSGKAGLSEMLSALSLPSFDALRWVTLHKCCKQLGTIIESLAGAWNPRVFPNARDPTSIRLVNEAWGA